MDDTEEQKEEIIIDPEEEDCEELNLSLADDASGILDAHNNDTAASAPNDPQMDDTDCCGKNKGSMDEWLDWNTNEYILGTLVVRVVAARNLQAVNKQGLPGMIFGEPRRSRQNRNSGGGTSNPYASVRFGSTTQRTSQVYGTTEPLWPRGETMYMDVIHPSVELDEQGEKSPEDGAKDMKTAGPAGELSQLSLESGGTSSAASSTASAPTYHPGDPPQKNVASTNPAASDSQALSPPLLTVAIFHASDAASQAAAKYNPSKHSNGDSDDTFLGMTSIDLTPLLTGRLRQYDAWLPLTGGPGQLRVVCEYETSDAPPALGDRVQLTQYCAAADVYPAVHDRVYTVSDVVDTERVLVSYTKEGWVSTLCVHRCMLMIVQRQYSVVDACQDELASIRERVSYSPMVHAVKDTLDKVPEEGLIAVSANLVGETANLLGRWFDGGLGVTAQDLNFATNWDGSQTPQLSSQSLHNLSLNDEDEAEEPVPVIETKAAPAAAAISLEPALPNMPACPITGEPMRDPVVAADGHTYERTAIARWLLESDKSPLTGSVLLHKDLVPNYMLLSSLQEAAKATKKIEATSSGEEEITSEVSLVEEF